MRVERGCCGCASNVCFCRSEADFETRSDQRSRSSLPPRRFSVLECTRAATEWDPSRFPPSGSKRESVSGIPLEKESRGLAGTVFPCCCCYRSTAQPLLLLLVFAKPGDRQRIGFSPSGLSCARSKGISSSCEVCEGFRRVSKSSRFRVASAIPPWSIQSIGVLRCRSCLRPYGRV